MTGTWVRLGEELPLLVPHTVGERSRERLESSLDYRLRHSLAKDTSERLRRAECERDAALAANRGTHAFLADLSHELRSPLQVMTNWISLLREDGSASERQEHALAVIERALRAQAALVDDLLDATRIARGGLTIETAPVDLATLVSEVVESHRLVADTQGVALEGPSPGEPLVVHGDARRLEQVVANLVTNALKFTPEGGVVRVVLVPEAARVVLEVRDTGQGIDRGLLPYVFDRFRQGDPCRRGGRPGLGLGLAIAKHLVERHGGSITAESEGEGRGATFRVTLGRGAAPT